MVKTAGSVACQEGGGSGWENSAQGRGDSRQEGSSQRWEETQTSGQGTRPQLCPLKAPGKGTKGLGWQVSPRVGKGPRQNLEKGGQQGCPVFQTQGLGSSWPPRWGWPPGRKLLVKSLLLSQGPTVPVSCQQWLQAGAPQVGRGQCDRGWQGKRRKSSQLIDISFAPMNSPGQNKRITPKDKAMRKLIVGKKLAYCYSCCFYYFQRRCLRFKGGGLKWDDMGESEGSQVAPHGGDDPNSRKALALWQLDPSAGWGWQSGDEGL